MPLRILVVSQSFWPNVGGAEIMVRRLAAEWTRLGNDVTVLTTDLQPGANMQTRLPAAETLEGFRIVRLHYRRARWLGALNYVRQLRSWLRAHRAEFDIVYVSMLKHAAYAVVGSGRMLSTPVVLRAEGGGASGDIAWQVTARGGQRIGNRCKFANALVAPSKAVHRELLHAGYNPDKTHLLENAVSIPPEDWSDKRRAEARQSLNLPDGPTVIYTGRLHPDKCLDDLLTALSKARISDQPVYGLIVGDGPDRERLQALCWNLKIADRVRFTGQVDDVQPYLLASDVFVLPSRNEGLSVALLEAMAAGVPSVASDIAANHGLFARHDLPLIPVNDPASLALAIESALDRRDDAGFRNHIRGLVAERFGLPLLAQRHLVLFQSLIRRS